MIDAKFTLEELTLIRAALNTTYGFVRTHGVSGKELDLIAQIESYVATLIDDCST